ILMNRTTKVEDAQIRNHSLNLNYEIKTDTIGSKLMTNASILFYKRGMESTNQTFPFDNSEYQSLRQIIPQKINNISLNADYIAKTKKENTWLFGANYIYTKTDNDTKQDNLINGNYIPDQVFTNHFLYKENIIGLYLTFER
ncbi:MAG: outer membrane beta-barrel protein, partial [Algoriella sp.]